MRRGRLLLVPAGLSLAIAAEWSSYTTGEFGLAVADAVVGLVLVVCGVVAWDRKDESRTGPLMALAGVTWFAGTVAPAALLWHRGPLVHLCLAYPTGRLRRRLATATVLVAYADAVIEPVGRNDVVTLCLALLVAVAAVDGFARTSGPARRAGALGLAASLAYAGVLAGGLSSAWPAGMRTAAPCWPTTSSSRRLRSSCCSASSMADGERPPLPISW